LKDNLTGVKVLKNEKWSGLIASSISLVDQILFQLTEKPKPRQKLK
jgi:hypothetical protein